MNAEKKRQADGDGAGDASTGKVAARHAGMGAIPYEGGVAFRLWAPHADAVHVAGPFNEWSKTASPLAAEEDGYWSADVDGAAANDEYVFHLQAGEEELDRADPYARRMTNSAGNSVVHDPSFDWGDDAFSMPPWHEIVIYEMHIGTFNDKNPDGPGTLDSGIARLDYLRDLGVNVLEIMPLGEFPGDISWGYNPSYIFSVESAYGGPEAFKQFVREAHKRGLAVVLDVVYNHFGPSDLDLWRFDGWYEGEGGGIYFYNDQRADTPWGLTRPDYGRPEVRQYIRDNVMMWLEEYRLDGLRWDGTVFIRYTSFFKDEALPDGHSLMQDITREVAEKFPGRLMIAEDLQGDDEVVTPVETGGLGFGTQWDARFVHPLRAALIPPSDEDRDMEAIRDAVLSRYDLDAFHRVIYTESHDECANGRARVPYEINQENAKSWESQKRSTLGAALVMTAPGIPMLFQGQEMLEDEWFCDTRPLDWDLLKETSGIHNLYRDLIRLRRNLDGTTGGLKAQNAEVHHLHPDEKILTLHRWDVGAPADSTLIIANFANRTHEHYRVGFPAEGHWRIRFNSDAQLYSNDFSDHSAFDVDASPEGMDNLPASAEVSIAPYSVLIYSQDPA